MPFVRPTITRLITRSQADIQTRLTGADALLRRSVEAVLARMSSGSVHGLHGHLVWLSRQLFPDTAEEEFLRRWCDIWGITQISAVKAGGTLTIAGVNTTVCPDETLWQTADGEVYEQDGAVTIVAGTADATVEAVDAGADGNQDVGATLSLVTPVTGIDSDGTVAVGGLVDGLDTEAAAALLDRLLFRLRTPPSGGGPGDYVRWALEVAGTTRAWQIPNADGLGTVALYFVQDDDAVDIVPSPGEIATMQTALEASAPVTANVTAYGPTEVALALTIDITPSTDAVKAAVTAEIEDLILRVGDPRGVTVSEPNRGTLLLSQLNESISIAAGETDHEITVMNGGAPADVVHAIGELPNLTTPITWA